MDYCSQGLITWRHFEKSFQEILILHSYDLIEQSRAFLYFHIWLKLLPNSDKMRSEKFVKYVHFK